jgi:uncharacterized RDD family membrane protein YckC
VDQQSQWRVDTPEQVDLAFSVAGLGARFWAVALDMMFQAAAFVLVIIGLLVLGDAFPEVSSMLEAALIIGAALLFFVYFILFEGFTHGLTPGKRICRLRVIREDGRPLDWGGALTRNLLRLIDFLPVFYGVGLVTSFLRADSRRAGDVAAGTIVVRTDKAKRAAALPSTGGRVWGEGPRVSRYPLREEEFSLVRDLLARKASFKPPVYADLCRQVAAPLFDRFMIPYHLRRDEPGFLLMLWRDNQ